MKPNQKVNETGSRTITKHKSERTFKYTKPSTNKAIENYISHKLNDESGTSCNHLQTSSSNQLNFSVASSILVQRLSEDKLMAHSKSKEPKVAPGGSNVKESHTSLHSVNSKGDIKSKKESGNSQVTCSSESNNVLLNEEDSLQIKPTPTQVTRPCVDQLDNALKHNSKLEEIKKALIELINGTKDKAMIIQEVENIYKITLRLASNTPNQMNEDMHTGQINPFDLITNSSSPSKCSKSKDNGDNNIQNSLKNEINFLKKENSLLKLKFEDITKKYQLLIKENSQLKRIEANRFIQNKTADRSNCNSISNGNTPDIKKSSSIEQRGISLNTPSSQVCPIPIPYMSEKMKAYFPQPEDCQDDTILSLSASFDSVPPEENKYMTYNQGTTTGIPPKTKSKFISSSNNMMKKLKGNENELNRCVEINEQNYSFQKADEFNKRDKSSKAGRRKKSSFI